MASCIRFLQCAGFRFDSPSWDGPEKWIALRNQDLWQTFQAILSLCQSEKIEFLFVCGNLFEQEYVRKETVERVASLLAKLEGTRIFITPGSSDPLIMTSAYRLAVWPSNVHIFSSGVSSVKVPSHNVTISGAGWTTYHQEISFLNGFHTTNDEMIQVMLLHAEVDSEQNTEGYTPILPEHIASSGLTYLALGDQKSWTGEQKAGKTFWANCGSPEARSFRESGSHGVIIGQIENEFVQIEFKELGQRRYVEKTMLFQSDIEELSAKILLETSPEERQRDLFRIKLTGPYKKVESALLPIQKRLMNEFRYLDVVPFDNETISRNLTISQNDGYPTLTKVFFDKLQESPIIAENDESYKRWELAKKIGMSALGQGRINYDN